MLGHCKSAYLVQFLQLLQMIQSPLYELLFAQGFLLRPLCNSSEPLSLKLPKIHFDMHVSSFSCQ